MAWKVTFDGFKTRKEAEEFAAWYGNRGEQESAYWLEEHTEITFAEAGDVVVDDEKQVVDVELKLYYEKGE